MIYLLLIGVFLATVEAYELQHWQNDFDKPLDFQCRQGYGIIGVKSIHSNHYEDRRFEYTCGYITDSSGIYCQKTNYVNSYDKPVNFMCGGNKFIAGAYSVHSDHHEDRIWQYRCCGKNRVILSGCHLTGWTNQFDGREYYRVPNGHVIKGVHSYHSNHHEDRRFRYVVCKVESRSEDGQIRAGLLEYLLNRH